MSVAVKIARRELRAGLKGFRIFLACLAIGVTAIAGAGSLSEAIHEGLRSDAQALHGGDLEVRAVYNEISAEQRAALEAVGRVTQASEMRSMARVPGPGGKRNLIEFKGVDENYPLYGALITEPALPREAMFGFKDGKWGAVIDRNLLNRLNVKVGDTISVGDAEFQVRAVIVREPDRVTSVFSFGPRVMAGAESLAATGLILPGSQIRYYYKVALTPPHTFASVQTSLEESWPDAGWRIRGVDQAAPGLERFLGNMTLFLSLVGLTALLVGGIGVANGVKAYMDSRTRTIAILKCVGGETPVIFRAYLIQILILAVIGVAIGLVLGLLVPLVGASVIGQALPVEIKAGVYPQPLMLAALFGLLTALTFALWPLAKVGEIPAAALFRDLLVPVKALPDRKTLLFIAFSAALLAAVTILTAYKMTLAIWFVVVSAIALGLFRLVAWGVMALARKETEQRANRTGLPGLRLALSNLHRPGAATPSVVLSLGLGLTVLVTVALIEGNMKAQIDSRIPEVAPTFFFIDIQPHQEKRFEDLVASVPGGKVVEVASMIRGRVMKLNGADVVEDNVKQDKRWVVQGDRALVQSAEPPPETRIDQGEWWAADYTGPSLVSVAADVADGLYVGVGDTVTVNVLGREITATIANTRSVDWSSLRMNFAMIFSPGTLDGAPRNAIATVVVPEAGEDAVETAVTDELPNVSAIRVKQALDAVRGIMAQAGVAIRSATAVTLLSGGLVLAGAIAAGHRRRVYESVILKVLGATRKDVLRAYLLEYGVLGIATGLLAAALGSLASWAVMTFIMHLDWVFLPGVAAVTVIACVIVTLGIGFLGTWKVLGAKASPFLRNE